MHRGIILMISAHRLKKYSSVFICRMFMYIFLGGLVALMLFGIYQVLESRTVRFFTISYLRNKKYLCVN